MGNSKFEDESRPARTSHINLRKKYIGKPSAGKPHAGFEEAGDGNGLNCGNRDITASSLDPTIRTRMYGGVGGEGL